MKNIKPINGKPAIYILAILLAACSRHTAGTTPEPEPVPIRLYTGIRTRAAVEAFDATPLCVACGTEKGSYTQCWEGKATGNEITLLPARYYPQDGSRLYIRAFYPPANMEQDGTLKYTLTGEEDLMLTDEQSGTKENPFTQEQEKILMHRHLLTQLSFQLKINVEEPGRYSIRSLHLNGLAREVRLELATEKLECGEEGRTVTIYDSTHEGEGLPFEQGIARLPATVLVQPEAELTIDIRLDVDEGHGNGLAYEGLPVHFEGDAGQGGIAYTVAVDIPDPSSARPKDVNVTATVGTWEDGNGGDGELAAGQDKEGKAERQNQSYEQ